MNGSILRQGWHDTFGWLRRRDEDHPYGFCYEKPDGELLYSGDPLHRDRALVALIKDDSGKAYITFCYTAEYRNGRL